MAEPTPVPGSAHHRLWRVVGGVGRALLVTGVLILLFVVYQLWGTGLQYSRSQDDLRKQFEQAPTSTTTTSTLAGTSTTPLPASSSTTAAPATTAPTTTIAAAPTINEGDVVARMDIPRLDKTVYVVLGVSVADLRRGPGLFPETALPGQLGNAAIAGHRTTYGAPFARIDELEPGDDVVMTTLDGLQYVYRVNGVPFVVPPSGVDVLADTPGRATLTLISCHPKYTARDRIVVQADLDGSRSAPASPRPGAPPAGTVTSTTAPPAGTVTSTTAPPETAATTSTTAPAPVTGGSTSSTAPPSPVTTAPTAGILTTGWFSDGGAWLGLILWGGALGVLSGAAWLIRRRRGGWLLPVAVLLPGLVLLYFFFENLNRLLPANL